MQRTKFGFYVGFDTTKRSKYSDKIKERILTLREAGRSVRDIAKVLDMPYGSIHYILKGSKILFESSCRPSNEYLNRAEAREQFDTKNSQFDYARTRYKELTVKVGGTVYVHKSYFMDYVINKIGYKRRYENV